MGFSSVLYALDANAVDPSLLSSLLTPSLLTLAVPANPNLYKTMGNSKSEVRDARPGEWYWVGNSIIEDYGSEIGPYGIAVYNYLAYRAGNKSEDCYPSVSTIATSIGAGKSTVRKHLKRLESAGLIEIKHRTKDNQHTSNLYTLVAPPVIDKEGVSDNEGGTSVDEVGTSGNEGGVPQKIQHPTSSDSDKQDSMNKTHSNQIQRESARTREKNISGWKEAETPREMYDRAFPDTNLTVQGVDLIRTEVDDMEAWEEAIHTWLVNGYNAWNVKGLVDCYGNIIQNRTDRSNNGGKNGDDLFGPEYWAQFTRD